MINQWQDFGDLPPCDGERCIAQNGEEVLAWSGINPDSASFHQAASSHKCVLCLGTG